MHRVETVSRVLPYGVLRRYEEDQEVNAPEGNLQRLSYAHEQRPRGGSPSDPSWSAGVPGARDGVGHHFTPTPTRWWRSTPRSVSTRKHTTRQIPPGRRVPTVAKRHVPGYTGTSFLQDTRNSDTSSGLVLVCDLWGKSIPPERGLC